MVRCRYCGYDNDENNKYCIRCSKKLFLTNIKNNIVNQQSISTDNNLKYLYYSFLSENIQQGSDIFNSFPNESGTYVKSFSLYKTTKKQFIATLLSTIFCGLGYFYLKDWLKGIIFLSSQIFLVVFANILFSFFELPQIIYIMYVTSLIVYLINIYDTFKESSKNEVFINGKMFNV